MSQSTVKPSAVKPIPDGFHAVTPHLVCANALDAMEFYRKAFGAVEVDRLVAPNGQLMHGCLRIGDSLVMLAEENSGCGVGGPKTLNGTPVFIHLYVTDADAVMAQATEAGAQITMPATDMFWGDRYGQVTDPFGHRWSIATHKKDLTPDEIQKGMASCMPPM